MIFCGEKQGKEVISQDFDITTTVTPNQHMHLFLEALQTLNLVKNVGWVSTQILQQSITWNGKGTAKKQPLPVTLQLTRCHASTLHNVVTPQEKWLNMMPNPFMIEHALGIYSGSSLDWNHSCSHL